LLFLCSPSWRLKLADTPSKGQWQSTIYSTVVITIESTLSDPDGVNNYLMTVNSCAFKYGFKIYESYIMMTNLQNKAQDSSCSLDTSQAISHDLG
jgi:hypothetical protein